MRGNYDQPGAGIRESIRYHTFPSGTRSDSSTGGLVALPGGPRSTDSVPEREAHPRTRDLYLRNAVLEAALRLATRDKKVAVTEPERARLSATLWPQ